MSKENPLLKPDFIILVRWIMFLPIGFILTATLQVIPRLGAELLNEHIPESTFLIIVGAILIIPILVVLVWIWFLAVIFTPYLSCGLIAPTKSMPAIIYGILFCLFEGTFLVSILAGGTTWVYFFYQLIFSGITMGGIVMLYKEIDPSRFRMWIPRGRTPKYISS